MQNLWLVGQSKKKIKLAYLSSQNVSSLEIKYHNVFLDLIYVFWDIISAFLCSSPCLNRLFFLIFDDVLFPCFFVLPMIAVNVLSFDNCFFDDFCFILRFQTFQPEYLHSLLCHGCRFVFDVLCLWCIANRSHWFYWSINFGGFRMEVWNKKKSLRNSWWMIYPWCTGMLANPMI